MEVALIAFKGQNKCMLCYFLALFLFPKYNMTVYNPSIKISSTGGFKLVVKR